MAKKVLALDLGITTGYAVFQLEGSIPLDYGEIKEEDYEYRLKMLVLEHLISFSVCEKPVIFRGQLGERLEILIAYTRVVLDHQVKFVAPAQWKQTPFKSSPCPRGTSPHVKDAIRLGLWYMHSLKAT